MPIEVRPTGMTGLYGQLGKLAGQTEAARKAEDVVMRMQEQLRAQEHDKEMAEFNAQLRIDTEKRARVWEFEKAEMSSRIDFEREERRRQTKLDERDAKLDALERAHQDGIIDEEDYNNARVQVETGVPAYTQSKIAERGGDTDPIKAHIASLLGGKTPTTPTDKSERIRVRTPEGETGTIEAWEWPLYETQGWSLAPAEPKPKVETQEDKLDERGYPKGYKQFRGFYF